MLLDVTHEELVLARLREFEPGNPLGLSRYMHVFMMVYIPILVLGGEALNIFAGWVLESSFLRDLLLQPLLVMLLRLNSILLVVGPLYVWCVQVWDVHIIREQIFHCYLLNLLHNFSLLASAFIFVTIIFVAVLSIGRPKSAWEWWRRVTSYFANILRLFAGILSLGELYYLDLEAAANAKKYPICVPWWENEHGSAVWYKCLACLFSLGPALLVIVGILLLEMCAARFGLLLQMGQKSLPDYQAMLLELSSSVHLKFVNSASLLGIAFLIFCTPVGLFITLGPAIQVKTAINITRIKFRPAGNRSYVPFFIGNRTYPLPTQAYLPPTHTFPLSTIGSTPSTKTDRPSPRKHPPTTPETKAQLPPTRDYLPSTKKPSTFTKTDLPPIRKPPPFTQKAPLPTKKAPTFTHKTPPPIKKAPPLKQKPTPTTIKAPPLTKKAPPLSKTNPSTTENYYSTNVTDLDPWVNTSDKAKVDNTSSHDAEQALHRRRMLGPMQYRYILVSRRDAEMLIWLMRYTFCLVVVPVLMLTEVLFAREMKGRLRQVHRCLCCRTKPRGTSVPSRGTGRTNDSLNSPWKERSSKSPGQTLTKPGSMAGPYIALVDGRVSAASVGSAVDGRVIKLDKNGKYFKVYDASKPARAGRKLDRVVNTIRTSTDMDGATSITAPSSVNTEATESSPRRPESKFVQHTRLLRNIRRVLGSRPATQQSHGEPSVASGGSGPPASSAANIPEGPSTATGPNSRGLWPVVELPSSPTVISTSSPGGNLAAKTAATTGDIPVVTETGMTEQRAAQVWDYQLLAQLAAVDARRRGFLVGSSGGGGASTDGPSNESRVGGATGFNSVMVQTRWRGEGAGPRSQSSRTPPPWEM